MIYIIGAIIAALGGLGAFIYNLLQKNTALKDLLNSKTVQEEISKINDALKAKEINIAEEERDYEQAKKDFDNRHRNTNGSDE